MLSTTGTYDGCYPWDFSKFTPQIQWSTILKFPNNCSIMIYHLVLFHGIPIFEHANTHKYLNLDIPSNPTKTLKISIMLMATPLNGSKWLVVGSKASWQGNIQVSSGLPLTILTCNRMPPTERTSLKASWMESPFLAKKMSPCWAQLFFPHERGSQQRNMWNFLTRWKKKQKSDWCKQWIAAEGAERPQTNQLPKYYPDPFNLLNVQYSDFPLPKHGVWGHHPKHRCII